MPPRLRSDIRALLRDPDTAGALSELFRTAAEEARARSREFPHGPEKRALIVGCLRLRDAADAVEKAG